MSEQAPTSASERPRVVILGGGFGGLCAARGLRKAPVEVVLVDRRNHHLFQPLLYQVATGGLSPANIAAPLRSLVRGQTNTRVLLAEIEGIDLATRALALADGTTLDYDQLVVATGAGQSYFGHDDWQELAPGLKTLEDATHIRRRVLLAFERAERTEDPAQVRELLTFVVVGGGPTGVELAGAIAELAYGTLPTELRRVDPERDVRVLLIEGTDRVLGAFSPASSAAATQGLEHLGVTVRTGCFVDQLDATALRLSGPGAHPPADNDGETLTTRNVFWAAGVEASPLGRQLAEQSEAEVDRIGRVQVEADCTLPGHPEVTVIGDLAHFHHGTERPLPGLAPVAMQQGRYVARAIRRVLDDQPAQDPFRYVDKGNMATVGRRMAVAEVGRIRIKGLLAWLAWLFVHLMYLAVFENRVLVLVQWGWSYVTRARSARLITRGPQEDDPG